MPACEWAIETRCGPCACISVHCGAGSTVLSIRQLQSTTNFFMEDVLGDGVDSKKNRGRPNGVQLSVRSQTAITRGVAVNCD